MEPRHYAVDKSEPFQQNNQWFAASMEPRHYAVDKERKMLAYQQYVKGFNGATALRRG